MAKLKQLQKWDAAKFHEYLRGSSKTELFGLFRRHFFSLMIQQREAAVHFSYIRVFLHRERWCIGWETAVMPSEAAAQWWIAEPASG